MARKKPMKPVARDDFAVLLAEVKGRIQSAQTRAILAVNAELVRLYWDIGRILDDRQQREGWGAAVIPRLAMELKNELPDLKGFSERNIGRMIAFYRAYPDPASILPQPAAKLPTSPEAPQVAAKFEDTPFWSIPWFHHVILMEKVKDLPTRRWYMEQTLANGWSRNLLTLQIDAQAHARQGKDGLDQHRASEQEGKRETESGDKGKQRVAERMLKPHCVFAQSFGARALNIGFVRHLEQACAQDACEYRRHPQR